MRVFPEDFFCVCQLFRGAQVGPVLWVVLISHDLFGGGKAQVNLVDGKFTCFAD